LEEGGFVFGFLLNQAMNDATQSEVLEVGAEDVVARAMLSGFLGEKLVVGIADDQNGNVRSGGEELFECGDAGEFGVGRASGNGSVVRCDVQDDGADAAFMDTFQAAMKMEAHSTATPCGRWLVSASEIKLESAGLHSSSNTQSLTATLMIPPACEADSQACWCSTIREEERIAKN
jgi:hypothetical protein